MNLVQGDIITLSGEEFLILDSMLYGDVEYAFGNKITKDEEPTKEYFVFKVEDNGESVERITEKEEVEIGELEELRKSKESYTKIVEQLLESIKKIKESFPYNKKEFLKSKILVDKKVEELKAEMEEYRNIYAQLEEIFKGLEGENNGWFG